MHEKILDFVINYISAHGYAPSFREIGDAVGLSSTSSVHGQIQKMLKMGLLESDHNGAARALRVPGYSYRKNPELHGEEVTSP